MYTWVFPDVKFSIEAQFAGALGKAAKFRSLYDIEKSNPVPASALWSGSGSKVNQFVHVPTSVDTQHFIQIHARFWVILLTDRQTDKQTRAKTRTSSFVGGNYREWNSSYRPLRQLHHPGWTWHRVRDPCTTSHWHSSCPSRWCQDQTQHRSDRDQQETPGCRYLLYRRSPSIQTAWQTLNSANKYSAKSILHRKVL